MALTTLKDFRIGACIAEISMYWKLPFGLKNPVVYVVIHSSICNYICICSCICNADTYASLGGALERGAGVAAAEVVEAIKNGTLFPQIEAF